VLINIFAGVVLLFLTAVVFWVHLNMKKEDKELLRLAEEGKKSGEFC